MEVWKFYDRLGSTGEVEKGEDWSLGEKAPRQRWPEYVQEGEEDDGSETSIGKKLMYNIYIKGEVCRIC